MLEIDKIKERFPQRAKTILEEYTRDFSKQPGKDTIPPNPPPAGEPPQKQLDLEPEGKSPKKNL